MIDKLLMLRGIGLFENGVDKPVALGKFNVLYAENGRGKSTLSDIMRSLSNGDGASIVDRKTIQGSFDPEVKFLSNNTEYYFANGKWSKTLPDIVVFDSIFVDANVYSGSQVDADHRKNLHRFALGEKGVQLAQEVEKLNQDIREANDSINRKEEQIRPHCVGGVTVDAFLRLPKTANIDTQIEEKRRASDAVKQQELIARRPDLQSVRWPSIDLDSFSSCLSSTIETVSNNAEVKTREHLAQLSDPRAEKWIEQGLDYVTGSECPFCGQSIEDLSLLESYRGYFSTEYARFKEKIKSDKEILRSALSEATLLSLQNALMANKTEQEFWSRFISIVLPDVNASSVQTALTSLRDELVALIDRKIAAPLDAISLSASLQEAWKSYLSAANLVANYNKAVADANVTVTAFKRDTAVGSAQDANAQLNAALSEKNRWLPDVVKLCEELTQLRNRKADLEKLKKTSRNNLDAYTKDVLGEYEKSINDFLTKSGAAFKIVDVKTSYTGGEPRSEYQVEILKCKMEVGGKKNASCPTFKSVLSDGDKRTLAFAFFLARLEHDPDITKRIVVCDDPVSSLDIHRQMFTHQRLIRIGEKCKQMIVLTHDANFAKRHWEEVCKDGKLMQICRVGDYSKFSGCDIDRICQAPWAHNVDTLCEYVSNGQGSNLLEVAKCIRPVVEAHLRIHYPRELKSAHMLGDILRAVRTAGAESPLHKVKPILSELEDINDYARQFHHEDNPSSYTTPVSDSELRGYVQRTLDTISRI